MRIDKRLKFILFIVCYTIGIIIMLSVINYIPENYSSYSEEDQLKEELKYYSKYKSKEDIEDYYNPPHFKCLGGWGTSAFRYCVNNKKNQMEDDIEKWNELKEKGLLQ